MNRFTIPYFPPLSEYQEYLKSIWKNQWITNNGPLVKQLEHDVSNFLETSNQMSFVTNGTIALQIAIECLDLNGEIITTPFSYVATCSSIKWQKCTPVFVDINPKTYAIDPELIEQKINENTTGILATHIFGNACEIDAIQKIADKHGLKVIYDAAHCFGTKFKGKSIFDFGDISTCSFHATKLFHTIEGGAIFSKNQESLNKVNLLRNFGHNGPETFSSVGINGKNSEVHAAMGLTILPALNEVFERRKKQFLQYKAFLDHPKILFQEINSDCQFNYAYCSIVLSSSKSFNSVLEMCTRDQIGLRRYFYPSLNKLPYYNQSECAISENIASRIFCLPMHFELTKTEIEFICKKILSCL